MLSIPVLGSERYTKSLVKKKTYVKKKEGKEGRKAWYEAPKKLYPS